MDGQANHINEEILKGITQDEYDKKAIDLKQRQRELDLKRKQYKKADEEFAITLSFTLDLSSSRAYQRFDSSKLEQKRLLINFVVSNLKLRGKKLEFELKKPLILF